MLEKFKQWYKVHDVQVTWFLLGVLITTALDSLAKQEYGQAMLCFVVAFFNFKLRNVAP